jgi:predicted MPP superfamily phosphohydrolase
MRRFVSFALIAGLFLAQCGPRSASRQHRFSAAAQTTSAPRPGGLTFPLEPNSVRLAVIGDSGTGDSFQYELARQMVRCRQTFPFDFVIMLGDNIYHGTGSNHFEERFELPYKPMLDGGVNFYASLGNHDSPSERFYKPFNMNGRRYYTFKKGNVRFFALDSNYMDPPQLQWLEKELQKSGEHWKICFFHHPLYSDGRFHGPDLDLRAALEPLFERYGVNVVLSGHDHVYERIKPQHGVDYFVLGNAGQLRRHGLRPSSEMAAGFDTDRAFMIVEITGNEFYFQTISRVGEVADHGMLPWQKNPVQADVTEHQAPVAPAARSDAPTTSDSVLGSSSAGERQVSLKRLVPNILQDHKSIWLFPRHVVKGEHLRPTLVLAGATAGLVALDPYDEVCRHLHVACGASW